MTPGKEVLHSPASELDRHYQSLDAAALGLVVAQVALVGDEDLGRPTPCDGWTVADLISHMNAEHEAIIEPILGPRRASSDDPRRDFPLIAARLVSALDQAGLGVMVPEVGSKVGTEQVWSIHLVDMIVHGWDVTRAVGRSHPVADEFVVEAFPIARIITAPASPLAGTVYAAPVAERGEWTLLDNLAAVLGRKVEVWFERDR
jgi:uncharacterized protein (TIGR03086 family)